MINRQGSYRAILLAAVFILVSFGIMPLAFADPVASADLKTLTIPGAPFSPAFSSDVTEYTEQVYGTNTTTTVSATAVDPAATVRIDFLSASPGAAVSTLKTGTGSASCPVSLATGVNTVSVVVTATDSTEKTYIVSVTRRPDLKSLTVSKGTLKPAFYVYENQFTVGVPYSVNSVDLTADANDNSATTIKIDGNAVTAKTPYTVQLDAGENIVDIQTQNQDGTVTCSYTLTITRYNSSWQQVGGSIHANAGAMYIYNVGGRKCVAYYDNGIVVKRFSGAMWETLGSKIDAQGSQYALYDCAGTPWLSYFDTKTANLMHVSSFDGSNWTEAFQADITPYRNNKAVYDVFDGTLYVAYSDPGNSGKLTVVRYDSESSAFETVGNSGFSAGAADLISLCVDSSAAYAAYRDAGLSGKASVMKLEGGTWVQVGDAGISQLQTQRIELAVDNGMPWLAYYQTNQGYNATVAKYDGSQWAAVGSTIPSGSGFGYLAVDGGVPYFAITDVGSKPTVLSYNGEAWQSVSNPCFTATQSGMQGIAVQDGVPNVLSGNLVYSSVPADTADLVGLVFNGSSGITGIPVDPSALDISIELPGYLSDVTITPVLADPGAAVSVNGQGATATTVLVLGNNDIVVAVTSQDGTRTKTYTIHADRQPDNYLTGLDVQGYQLAPAFSKDVTAYSVEVEGYTDTLLITPALSDTGDGNGCATVTVDGQPAASGSASQVAIGAQSRTIEIIVTARDGVAQRKYMITANKQAATYQKIGSNISASSSFPQCLAISVYNDVPYVGYVDDINGKSYIHVVKFYGAKWVAVGSAIAGGVSDSSKWLNVYKGVPYILYNDAAGAYVRRFNGATWELVGGSVYSSPVASASSLFIDSSGIYAALSDRDTDRNSASSPGGLWKYDGAKWVKLGSNGMNWGYSVTRPIVSVYNGVPYVAYSRGQTDDIDVVTLTGGQWAFVGHERLANNTYMANFDFGLDFTTGTPYLAYAGYVLNYVNGSWQPLGGYNGTSNASVLSMAILDGSVILGTIDKSDYNKITIKTYQGGKWVNLGYPLSSRSGVLLAQSGRIPYILCIDSTNSFKDISAYKYQGSSDATLSGIAVAGTSVTAPFSSAVKAYTAYVADNALTASITAIPSDRYATVQINGSAAAYGSPCTVPLPNSSNTVTITVKSLDGSAMDSYSLTILRAPVSDSKLRALNIYGGIRDITITPAFASSVVSYKATTPYSVSTVTLAALTKNPLATVTGAGLKTLKYGVNNFSIVVKSRDGKSSRTYTIAVTRSYPAKPTVASYSTMPSASYGFTPGGTNTLVIKSTLTTPVPATYKTIIYNSRGKIVAVYTLANQTSGAKSVSWNGKATAGNTAGLKVGAAVPVSSAGTVYTVRITAQNPGGSVTTSAYAIKLFSNPVVSKFSVSPTRFYIDTMFGQSYITAGFQVNHMTNVEVRFVTPQGQIVKRIYLTNVIPNKINTVKWNGYNGSIPAVGSQWKVQIIAGNTTYKPSTAITVIWP